MMIPTTYLLDTTVSNPGFVRLIPYDARNNVVFEGFNVIASEEAMENYEIVGQIAEKKVIITAAGFKCLLC